MARSNSKPQRSALDLFLLAAVNQGIQSIYQLRERLSLSVGATQPALARLVENGLLTRRDESSRSKVSYSLTAPGRKALSSEWRSLVEFAPTKPFSETETIMRLTSIALEFGTRRDATKLLERARNDRIEKVQRKIAAIKNMGTPTSTLAKRYRNLRSALEVAQLKAEAAIFLEKIGEINERKL